jgi:hypothetical protein
MAQHKWHKEIKAWADGKDIELRFSDRKKHQDDWTLMCEACWDDDAFEFRIKPQPKEPQYLYVYLNNIGQTTLLHGKAFCENNWTFIGKIKLEDNDNGND